MPRPARLLNLLLTLLLPLCARASANPDWTTPVPPFEIADNLYYVGSRDLASYLLTTPAGNILINANLTSSPPQIRHSIEQLGFRWRDTKILLISHAHFDHAAGSAEILKQTGARLEVMEGDVDVMESGGRTDFAFGPRPQFPAAHVDHTLHDNEKITLGGLTVVAHRTPGHTRGTTTFSLRAHLPGDPATQLRDVVIVGSWSVLSEYRLLGQPGKPPSYPGIAGDFTMAFALLHTLPCDIFLASHGSLFDLPAKLKRLPAEGPRVWIDPQGYQAALGKAQRAFELAYEREARAAAAEHTR